MKVSYFGVLSQIFRYFSLTHLCSALSVVSTKRKRVDHHGALYETIKKGRHGEVVLAVVRRFFGTASAEGVRVLVS